MEQVNQERIYNGILFKFVNTIAGPRTDFFVSLLISILIGLAYSFRIWDQVAVLFVFGMLLPSFYILALYRLIRLIKSDVLQTNVFSGIYKGKRYYFAVLVDILLTILIGIFILFGILDYIIIRLVETVIFPFIYLSSLHILVNYEDYQELM